jgi:hypothetical protein
MMSVAVSTATLTVVALWSVPLEAGKESEALTPKLEKPKLVAKGVEITLAHAGSGDAQAGDEPVFELAADNTTAEPAELTVQLVMTSMSPADAMSRVVRLPASLWECNQRLVLGPHEHKTLTLATRTKLPAKNIISVSLREAGESKAGAGGELTTPLTQPGTPGIAVLSFPTVTPEPKAAAIQSNS